MYFFAKRELINQRNISYRQEIYRKSIHLTSLSIPIIYSFIDKETALMVFIPLTIISIVLDIFNHKDTIVRRNFNKIFGKLMRQHEVGGVFTFNGATWMLVSATACALLFPKLFFVTGFAILIISDTSAALYGRKFGRIPFFNKSLEGSLAFVITAYMVVLITGFLNQAPWTYFLFGFIAALVSGLVEAMSSVIKVDDNISIPLSVGLTLWAGEFIAIMLNASYFNVM